MTVAYELGKRLDEVYEMPLDEFADWLAYLKIRNEQAKPKDRGNNVRERLMRGG